MYNGCDMICYSYKFVYFLALPSLLYCSIYSICFYTCNTMDPIDQHLQITKNLQAPYSRERGPMGGAPYIGPRLGDGPIFEVSMSRLDTKEHPGKLPTLASYLTLCTCACARITGVVLCVCQSVSLLTL